jgi:hypothetical protein
MAAIIRKKYLTGQPDAGGAAGLTIPAAGRSCGVGPPDFSACPSSRQERSPPLSGQILILAAQPQGHHARLKVRAAIGDEALITAGG